MTPTRGDHLLGAAQAAQVVMDDDAVEAVVYKNQQIAEQPGEEFHRNFTLPDGATDGPEDDQTRVGQAGNQRQGLPLGGGEACGAETGSAWPRVEGSPGRPGRDR